MVLLVYLSRCARDVLLTSGKFNLVSKLSVMYFLFKSKTVCLKGERYLNNIKEKLDGLKKT